MELQVRFVFESRPVHHITTSVWCLAMPKQIHNIDKFLELSDDAEECRVMRVKDQVKLKLRTRSYLYTLIVEPQKAEELLQQIKCQVVEARTGAEEA